MSAARFDLSRRGAFCFGGDIQIEYTPLPRPALLTMGPRFLIKKLDRLDEDTCRQTNPLPVLLVHTVLTCRVLFSSFLDKDEQTKQKTSGRDKQKHAYIPYKPCSNRAKRLPVLPEQILHMIAKYYMCRQTLSTTHRSSCGSS